MYLKKDSRPLIKTLLSAGSLATVFSMLATPASAQDNSSPLEIEEIIVTAQKREENLQDAPLAVTALSGQAVEDRGIKSIFDLFTSAPGMNGYEAPSSRGNISLNIRGISSGSPNNISLDPANGIYVDGVYLGKATGLGVDAGDLERVEILRGPQGTLYGRNSTGGAINFISRKPSGEFGFTGTATAGSEGLSEYKLRLELPKLGDTLSTAFSIQKRERDPLYDNTNPDLPGFENIDRLGYRFSARFEPSESFSADYSFDHSEIDNEYTQALAIVGQNPLGAGILAAPGLPGNVATNSNDRVAAIAQVQQFLPFLGPGFFAPEVQQFNQWLSDYLAWDASGRSQGMRDPSSVRQSFGSSDSLSTSANEVDGHSLTLTWTKDDFGSFGDVEFKSITGFRETTNTNDADLDGIDNTLRAGPGGLTTGVINDLTLLTISQLFFDGISPQVPAGTEFALGQAMVNAINTRGRAETFATFQKTDHEQFSQELQMVGSTERLDYAVGLFYYSDEGSRQNNSTSLFPIAFTSASNYNNETTATSIYGQFTWRPSADSPLSLTGGLRHTEEDKDVTYLWRSSQNPAGFLGPFFAGMSPAVTYVDNADALSQPEVAGIFGRDFSKGFSNTSGKASIAYAFNDDVNVFATYATGYRSGGFNGEAFNTADDTADAFDEETISSFELGIKSTLLDGRMRLNATYFTYVYDDLQIGTLLARPDGSVTSNTDNAGKAERSGLEAELTLLPIEDLLLSVNLSTFDGDFEEFPPVVGSVLDGGQVLDTSNLAQRTSPDVQVSFNADWTITQGDWGLLQLNVNGIWQDEWQSIGLNTATYDTNGNRLPDTPIAFAQQPNDERTMINARLALNEMPVGDGSLSVGLWGRNLTDDDHRNFSFNFGPSIGTSVAQFGEQVTYGIDLTYRYE